VLEAVFKTKNKTYLKRFSMVQNSKIAESSVFKKIENIREKIYLHNPVNGTFLLH